MTMLRKTGQFSTVILLLVFSCVFLSRGVSGLGDDFAFKEKVVRTEGTIERMWINHSRRSYTTYYVTYRFEEGDRVRESTARTLPDTYLQMRDGGTIPVKFLSVNPDKSRVDRADEDRSHWIYDIASVGYGIVFMVFAIFVAWLLVPRNTSSWEEAAVDLDSRGKGRWN